MGVTGEGMCAKEVGGLVVRDVRSLNLTLLEKWKWRVMVEKGSSWYNVLAGIYREKGQISRNEKKGLSWWKSICKPEVGVGVEELVV